MYEIPKALRYEEKVAFGLTFKQIVWLFATGGAAAVLFFKLGWPTVAKAAVAASFLALGCFVAFKDLDQQLKHVLAYVSGVKESGYLDKHARRLLEVRDVRDNIIIKDDNHHLAIVQAEPLNLSVKSSEEREAIIRGFSEFLNSLPSPVQILIRTTNSLKDIRNYFDFFESEVANGNRDIKAFFEEHRRFFESYIRMNSVKNRLFYLILSHHPRKGEAIEKAQKELEVTTEIVREKLAAIGIRTARLSTDQLITFLASYFEDFVEVKRDYLFPLTFLKMYGERHEE